MSNAQSNRRQFLATGASGALAGMALVGCAPKVQVTTSAAAPAASCGGMPKERYLDYVAKFNANDPSFTDYYHDDVVLQLGTTENKTAKGIRDFYAEVKAHIHEKVDITHYVADATGIAAELPTEFRVYKDWDNGFFGRPLKVGHVLRVVSLGLYWVKDGKFTHIKSARSKLLNDWQMETGESA
jgi:hypothetical protein